MQGVLVFLAAGQRMAVSTGDVMRLVMETATSPIPFSHPALAGVMDHDTGVTPVFDLRGLSGDAVPAHVEGAMVAVIPTSIGPIGLRLDKLLGTAARYTAVSDSEVPAHSVITSVTDGAGRADELSDAVFFFFSTDAFIHAIGLS